MTPVLHTRFRFENFTRSERFWPRRSIVFCGWPTSLLLWAPSPVLSSAFFQVFLVSPQPFTCFVFLLATLRPFPYPTSRMLHHHGEVSNILFDSGPTVNLQSLHRGLSSIYRTSAYDLLIKILQVLLIQGLEKTEYFGCLGSSIRDHLVREGY